MRLKPLADYLAANLPELKEGKTLFVNQMPVDIPFGLMLKESFGGTQIDGELIGRRRGKFQVVARSKDYAAGEAIVIKAMNALSIVETLLPGNAVFIRNMRPLTKPVAYMLTAGNNFEFSVNMSAIYDIVA